MFSVATVFLLLASLVAAAGFAVVAQRRLRQLGMLAAIGATQKHLRLVLLTNGAVVGAIAALIGTIAGVALWVVFAPTLESAIDHRIDRLSLPWALLAMVVLLAVLGATAAAWWPGRTVARLPVAARALGATAPAEARTPLGDRGRSADRGRHRLSRAVRPRQTAAHHRRDRGDDPRHSAPGPAGDPHLLRSGRACPDRPRLALRDLARYQARSGAALAAITLALGIAAAVVVTAAAEEKKEDDRVAAELPNLSDRQIRVYTGPTRDPELIPLPIQTPAQLARSAARVRQLAAGLGQAAVIPLRKAFQPGEPPIVTFEGDRALVAVGLSRQDRAPRAGPGDPVSTSPRLPCSGTSESTPPRSTRARTSWPTRPSPPTSSSSWTSRARRQLPVTNVQRIDSRQVLGAGEGDTGRVPSSFVTLDGLRRHGWKQVPSGWLVESSRPLTSEQIAAARELAAEAGLDDRDTATRAPPSPRPSPSRPPQAPSWRSRSSP